MNGSYGPKGLEQHESTGTFHPIIAFRLAHRITNTVWLEDLDWATKLDVKEFQSIHPKK